MFLVQCISLIEIKAVDQAYQIRMATALHKTVEQTRTLQEIAVLPNSHQAVIRPQTRLVLYREISYQEQHNNLFNLHQHNGLMLLNQTTLAQQSIQEQLTKPRYKETKIIHQATLCPKSL